MSTLFLQLLNGIAFGFLLFLVASGLTLIFGFMRIANMAHGSYYLVAGYVGYTVSTVTGGNFVVSVVSAIATIAVLGAVTERFLFRRLPDLELQQVLLTFGMQYVFIDVCKTAWGTRVLSIPKPPELLSTVNVLGIDFPMYRLFLIALGLFIAAGLWYLQERTLLGAKIRAGVNDREMVTGLGINVNVLFTVVFTLGAALAGLAGGLGGPVTGMAPGVDLEMLILALVVVVVGGLGSLKGALLGSLVIGLADTFGKAYAPEFAMFTIYVVMALILVWRPSGLLGVKE